MAPALAEGRHLVCLPGTHTKWVSLHDGVVLDFLTAPTGELFAAAVRSQRAGARSGDARRTSRRRVRARPRRSRAGTARLPCCTGCSRPAACASTSSCRPEGAASWTSGLLIGADVGGALPLFGAHSTDPACYVDRRAGALRVCTRMALARHGRHAESYRRRRGRRSPDSRAYIATMSGQLTWSCQRTHIEMVAILRGLTPQRAPEVGAALVAAGFRSIEVPLNSPEPFDTIKLLAGAHGARLPGRRRHRARPPPKSSACTARAAGSSSRRIAIRP